ncbi:hypothetical protein ACS0TY_026349 [Phlomoides rotata]
MGFKVIVFLGIFIGMTILLISSQVGAARMLAQTVNTAEASEKTKGIIISPRVPQKPFCHRNEYGKCIELPKTSPFKKRPCNYKNACKGHPPNAKP